MLKANNRADFGGGQTLLSSPLEILGGLENKDKEILNSDGLREPQQLMCQNGKRGLRLCLPIKGGGAKAPEGLLNKKKSAFTLAEVLITLCIIGIVAAMTLPALIQNYQKNILFHS